MSLPRQTSCASASVDLAGFLQAACICASVSVIRMPFQTICGSRSALARPGLALRQRRCPLDNVRRLTARLLHLLRGRSLHLGRRDVAARVRVRQRLDSGEDPLAALEVGASVFHQISAVA